MTSRVLLAVLLAAPLATRAADGNVVNAVQVTEQGGAAEVSIRGSKPPSFSSFSLVDPPRFVVDLSETTLQGVKRNVPGKGGVKEVNVVSFGEGVHATSRVTVTFVGDVEPPDVRVSGSELVIRVESRPGAGVAVAAAPPPPAPPAAAAPEAPPAPPPPPVPAAVAAPVPVVVAAAPEPPPAPPAPPPAPAVAAAPEAPPPPAPPPAPIAAPVAAPVAPVAAAAPEAVVVAAPAPPEPVPAPIPAPAPVVAPTPAPTVAPSPAPVAAPVVAAPPPAPPPAPAPVAKAPPPPAPAAAAPAPRPAGPNLVEQIGFKLTDGGSRVFVRTRSAPRFRVSEPKDMLVRIEFPDTRPGQRNDLQALDTSFFPSAVIRVAPHREGRSYVVDIQLRDKVSWQQRIDGETLTLEFARPAAATGK